MKESHWTHFQLMPGRCKCSRLEGRVQLFTFTPSCTRRARANPLALTCASTALLLLCLRHYFRLSLNGLTIYLHHSLGHSHHPHFIL